MYNLISLYLNKKIKSIKNEQDVIIKEEKNRIELKPDYDERRLIIILEKQTKIRDKGQKHTERERERERFSKGKTLFSYKECKRYDNFKQTIAKN